MTTDRSCHLLALALPAVEGSTAPPGDDLNKLDTVDVVASYWMGDAIAHVMVSYGFVGQDYLAISIETRKERTESYSTLAGFFREYELYYVVADERDLIGVRTNYRKDPPEEVYLYRTNASPANVRRLFLSYIAKINSLKDHNGPPHGRPG